MTPQHEHDACSRCVFLTSIADVDLWYCPSTAGTCYMVRYSSEPSDYASHTDSSDLVLKDMQAYAPKAPTTYHRLLTLLRLCTSSIASVLYRQLREETP